MPRPRECYIHHDWSVTTAWVAVGLALLAATATASPGDRQEVPAQRVVSLVPAATEILFAMGAGPSVVGVSSYDTWPVQVASLPKLGALLDPDEERILRLRPEVAILDPGHVGLRRRLRSVGIAVFSFPHGGLETALDTIRDIGRAVGRPAEGDSLAESVGSELEALRARYASRPPARTLVVFGRGQGSFQNMWVIAGDSFTHELVEIAGGVNVFGDIARASFKVGLEGVLAAAPDAVIELRPARGRSVDAAALEAEWRGLPGFANTTVAVLADDSLLVPGPRMPRAVRLIAQQLHGRRP